MQLIAAGAVFTWASVLLTACSPAEKPQFKSIDLTGADYATGFALPDQNGTPRTLKDFAGKVVVVFFGYTQCPDVCPTTLAALAEATVAIASAAMGQEARAVDDIYAALELTEDLVAYTPAAVVRATAHGRCERVVAWTELPGLDELRDACTATGTALELVSDRSEAGARLVREFGGAAALLRW